MSSPSSVEPLLIPFRRRSYSLKVQLLRDPAEWVILGSLGVILDEEWINPKDRRRIFRRFICDLVIDHQFHEITKQYRKHTIIGFCFVLAAK